MDKDSTHHTVMTSVRVPIALRSRLEHLKLARAERGMRMPRLRDLISGGVERARRSRDRRWPRSRFMHGGAVMSSNKPVDAFIHDADPTQPRIVIAIDGGLALMTPSARSATS